MFSEMISALNRSIFPEPASLEKRFDFALTKKLGVIKLPPAFRMADPKINPRADHLLWSAMLLLDPNRIELALSVVAVEITEISSTPGIAYEDMIAQKVAALTDQLMQQIPDPVQRKQFEARLLKVMPEFSGNKQGVIDE